MVELHKKADGGPAFPTGDNPDSKLYAEYGMSLRDYFAAKALPAILASPDDGIQAWHPQQTAGSALTAAEAWAKNAYQIADAMLAERAK